MRKIIDKTRSILTNLAIICMALSAVAVVGSCSNDDEGDGFGNRDFVIVGTTTNSDGVAVVSCDGRAQSISLVFKAKASYVITTNGDEWINIVSGERGEGGNACSVKLKVTDNMSGGMRSTDVYIEVEGKRSRLAEITQSVITMDAIVQTMDKRLEAEYYWLDGYKRIKQAGKIDYTLTGQNFLNGALLNMGNVNLSDGYYDSNGKRRLFSYVKEIGTSRASEGASLTNGYGVALCYTIIAYRDTPNYGFLVEHVYPGSPAAMEGIQRGDEILTVNGKSIDSSNYSSLFNTLQSGSGTSITIGRREAGNVVEHTLSSGSYYKNPIACAMVLEEQSGTGYEFGDKKIGYISYLSFDHDYDDDLATTLRMLQSQGVTDMIIDLRSNGGGHVITSAYFASMLLSEEYVDKPMVVLERHKDNMNGNTIVPFYHTMSFDDEEIELPHLGMDKVCFITSDNTASASEMLIMGLRAQGVTATTVGKTSMGKDCGMDVYRISHSGKVYEFAPITFMNRFENYNVDFSEGIIPDVDFNALKNGVLSEEIKNDLEWFPLPERGVVWGDYMGDIALREAVANILGGSSISSVSQAATRAVEPKPLRKVEMPRPMEMGMYLTERDREKLTTVE